MSLNNVTLMGRLTNDIEIRQTPNGVLTTQFTLAVERDYADKNGERQTDFLNCVAWRSTAEFVSKYFSKGSMIAVVGSLRSRSYDDKRYPDVKHFVTEVYVEKASFTGEKKKSEADQPQSPASTPAAQQNYVPPAPANQPYISGFEQIGDGDLPF